MVNKIDASGGFLTMWGAAGSDEGQFDGPRGIATDASGLVYVCRLITLVAILAAIGAQARAAPPDSAAAAMDTTASPAEPASSASFRLWFEFGLGHRLGDRPSNNPDGDKTLASFEAYGFRWDGHSGTWGLGVRSALDDLGFRIGPKALVRRPLGGDGKVYCQLAASYYLFRGDGNLADRPGWALEAEIATAEALALVLGLELIRYELADYSYGDEAVWFTESINSTYLSVKFIKWWGVGVTVALIVMGLFALGA